MKILLENTNFYYLTLNNPERKAHLLNELKNYSVFEVNPPIMENKMLSGSIGHSRMLDLATQHQNTNQPFKPFVILEDDIKKCKELPKNIDIPDDTDWLYVGVSQCGLNSFGNDNSWQWIKNVDDTVCKIYHMLGTHAIMICSVRGLLAYQRAMSNAHYRNIDWDKPLAAQQHLLNVYALKNPLFYQYAKLGGLEHDTNFQIKEKNQSLVMIKPNNNELNNKFVDVEIKPIPPHLIQYFKTYNACVCSY